ncbi:hypothetical protein J6590_012315 [Homalodisca vitripennis]|nr:hypothetical protein J6590_012315 [Homalodisca vitripennis]
MMRNCHRVVHVAQIYVRDFRRSLEWPSDPRSFVVTWRVRGQRAVERGMLPQRGKCARVCTPGVYHTFTVHSDRPAPIFSIRP